MEATVNRSMSWLGRRVDALGDLNAQIADLQARASSLKAEIVAESAAAGTPIIEGARYRASVVITARESIDGKAAGDMLRTLGMEPPMKSTLVTSVRLSGG